MCLLCLGDVCLWSTCAGSPESLRDPRGFAVKFYTREGNFDMVGNNMPVFFVRDGIKFPDMVHALKPNIRSNVQVSLNRKTAAVRRTSDFPAY